MSHVRLIPAFALLSLAHTCLAAEPPESVKQQEAEAVEQLEEIGASVELDDQGYAISVRWYADEEIPFDDRHLKLVAKLPHLKELWLVQSEVTDNGLQHLKNLKEIETLVLNCRYIPNQPAKITDAGMKSLKKRTTLKKLWLRDSDVTDRGLADIAALTNLEDLGLFGTEISDAGLVHLQKLKKLTYLDVAETQWEKKHGAISLEAVKTLRTHLPKCIIDY